MTTLKNYLADGDYAMRHVSMARMGKTESEAINKLENEGFEHMLDRQWEPIPNKLILAYEDGETEAVVKTDGMVTFTMWTLD
jgi:hypothetical protein